MNDLTQEDLNLLRDTAARYFEEEMPLTALRKLRDENDDTGFDRDTWRAMAEMGWAGILLEERDGGIGFGYAALGSILEQAGKTLAASPLVSTALLCAPIIAAAGNTAQRAAMLPSVANGDCILALAHEEESRHCPYTISTTAAPNGDAFVINGRKRFILDGHIADQIIVVARTSAPAREPGGVSLFIVDPSTDGVVRTRTTMVDSRNAANIAFENVTVPSSALLGKLGSGFNYLSPALEGARAGVAAEMLGTGVEVFDRTIEYLKVREQFGAKIGSFQALKHRAAEMYCEIELTRSATDAALAAADVNAPELAELASLAKAKACEMLELVTNEGVQMHGGIGMTDEADIGLFLKRARVAQQTFGDVIYHRQRYADLIGL